MKTVDNKGNQEDSIEVDLLNLNDKELELSGLNELGVVEDENNTDEVEDYHKKNRT